MSAADKYEAVIGLEVHAQLVTESKIYSADSTAYGAEPNTQVSGITLGLPGTLPRLNGKVIELAVKMGLACRSEINRNNILDRKNYFYPDLPKGYQLTQDRAPLCIGGYLEVTTKEGTPRKIRLRKIHIEEDAGKLMHHSDSADSLVDFNRAGVPLIEIVTEPDVRTSEEAYLLLTEIRKVVRYLGICDGNMEEGSLRCDANVSVKQRSVPALGVKVEIKNMNSIRNVQRAINHEIERQITMLDGGEDIISETRTFDAESGKTFGMRTKEDLNDYRYFPDPDLSPVIISDAWLDTIVGSMPELPWELERKYVETFKLPAYDARVITGSQDVALLFEDICRHTSNYKAASNWIMGPVKAALNGTAFTAANFPVNGETIADLIALVESNKLSFVAASHRVFPELLTDPHQNVMEIAGRLGVLISGNRETLKPLVEEVVKEFPAKVDEYRRGKKSLIGMFMGEVMRRGGGKVDPKLANEMLTEILERI